MMRRTSVQATVQRSLADTFEHVILEISFVRFLLLDSDIQLTCVIHLCVSAHRVEYRLQIDVRKILYLQVT